jgi:hypothetical protein
MERCAPVRVCGSAKVERLPQIFQTSVVDGGSRDCPLILNELLRTGLGPSSVSAFAHSLCDEHYALEALHTVELTE